MGTDILPGRVLEDNTLVHDADFNALVGDATILPTAISAKTLKTDMSLGDELLINDAGTLKKITGQQIVSITVLPAGCMMDFAGTTEPLGWVFCYGQALSRTTYAALFTSIGIAYGAGDGSTTFNVPDFRGRVMAGRDDMGGTAANRITSAVSGFDAKVLGNQGGSQSHTLVTAETPLAAHTHPGIDHTHTMAHTHVEANHTHKANVPGVFTGAPMSFPYGTNMSFHIDDIGYMYDASGAVSTGGTSTPNTGSADRSLTTGANTATGGAAHRNLQPTIILNKIIKT